MADGPGGHDQSGHQAQRHGPRERCEPRRQQEQQPRREAPDEIAHVVPLVSSAGPRRSADALARPPRPNVQAFPSGRPWARGDPPGCENGGVMTSAGSPSRSGSPCSPLFVVVVIAEGHAGAGAAVVAFIAIAALVGAGNALYGRHSHGKKAIDRVRPAQEAQNRAADRGRRGPPGRGRGRAPGRALLPARPRPPQRIPPQPRTREPLPRQGRRPAHLPPGRGRQDRRLPHRAPRQGARRRQGHPQDHLQVRRPPRAADPGRPPAVAGEGRPRHREPGGGPPRLPPHHGRTSTACREASRSSR